jgi:hypothetical protein
MPPPLKAPRETPLPNLRLVVDNRTAPPHLVTDGSMSFYIYALFHPSDTALAFPRYVGKGKGARAFCHPTLRTKRVRQWMKEELDGEEPLFDILACNLFEDEALSLERDLISLYGRERDGGSLLNVASGGGGAAGVKRSPDAIAKTAAANRGRKRSTASRARMSAAHKTLSAAHRAKLTAGSRAYHASKRGAQHHLISI